MGNKYNCWLPIYVNEEHFKRNLTIIENSLTILKYGCEGHKEFDFKPQIIVDIMPMLLNSLTVYLVDGTIWQSIAAIESYCHYIQLFKKFAENYPTV